MSAGKFKTSVQEAIWMVCCWWWWWMRYHLCCLRCGIEVSPARDQRELDSCHSRGSKWAWSWILFWLFKVVSECFRYSFLIASLLGQCVCSWSMVSLLLGCVPCEKWGQLEGRSTIFKTGIFDLFFWANFSRTLLIFIFPTRPSHWYLPHFFGINTVDGRNPAPADRWFIPLFIGFQPSKVVQDFFHPLFTIFYLWKNIRSSTFFGFFERDHLNQEQAKVERDMQLAQQDSGGGKSPSFLPRFFHGTRSSLKHWTWSHKIVEEIMYLIHFYVFSATCSLFSHDTFDYQRVFVVWYDIQ